MISDQDANGPADRALVASARSGDREAFGLLLARHRSTVVALCVRLMGDRFLAEDAFQEAALTAMTNLDRLQRPERFGAWLAGIALNVGRRWLRRRAYENPMSGAHEQTGGGVDPADIAERHNFAARVHAAVACLPAGQRDAVVAYFLLGMTQREAAELLGTTPGAVKTRLHKARGTLRRQLSDEWEETAMAQTPTAVPVNLIDVYAVERDGPLEHYVALLGEIDGDRRLPIWIGEPEATALALTLQGTELVRPMTYHASLRLLHAAGANVHELHITRLTEGTYYATIAIDGSQGRADVDVRPSDGLNLALLAGVPITVDDTVFVALDAAATAGIPATVDDLTGRVRATSAEIMQRRQNRMEALLAAPPHQDPDEEAQAHRD